MNASYAAGRILVVEDEPKLAALIGRYLGAAGYTTQMIADGRMVVPAVRAEPPDLVHTPMSDGTAWLRVLGSAAVLLVIAIPALSMRLGLPDGASQPQGSSAYQAHTLTAEKFGPGANGPDFGDSVQVPDEIDVQRARQILEIGIADQRVQPVFGGKGAQVRHGVAVKPGVDGGQHLGHRAEMMQHQPA